MGIIFNEGRSSGVDQRLVDIAQEACQALPFDVIVVEGVRTKQRQQDLYAQGRTKPGKIVTWTMNSKHIDGLAVDLAPYDHETKQILWGDVLKFNDMIRSMLRVAADHKVKIRSGADWNQNGVLRENRETDSPHFELG